MGAGLTASRFVSGAQVGSGRVWATSKALLSRDDEPVIGFATDIGASGRGALHGCNQMRIAQLGQSETSRKISDCKSNFKIEAAKKKRATDTSAASGISAQRAKRPGIEYRFATS